MYNTNIFLFYFFIFFHTFPFPPFNGICGDGPDAGICRNFPDAKLGIRSVFETMKTLGQSYKGTTGRVKSVLVGFIILPSMKLNLVVYIRVTSLAELNLTLSSAVIVHGVRDSILQMKAHCFPTSMIAQEGLPHILCMCVGPA